MSAPGTPPHDLCGSLHGLTPEDRGFAFADQLYGLVSNYGPADLSPTLKNSLAEYLLEAAVEWVKAHNRLVKGRA